MPKIDAVANVIVLAAAGIGSILAVVCTAKLLRHLSMPPTAAG